MLKKFAPIALALSLAAGALPATAEVYQAGTRQASEFARQHLVGVYKFQQVYAFGHMLDPGFLRISMDADGNLLFAQNDKPMQLTLQSVDTNNRSANLIDDGGRLETFRNAFGIASLTMESGTISHATFVRALAPQDIAVVERAYGASAPAQPAMPSAPPAPAAAPAGPDPTETAAAKHSGPSFSCAKSSTAIEGMICGNSELAELDLRLADAYKWLLGESDNPADVKREQIAWVRNERNACKTVDCLARAYTDRAENLETMAHHLSKPKEFR